MTTAYLDVLNEYATDINEFIDFREALGRWACRWIGEVATPIARNAKELFENRAIYGLVMQWDRLEAQGREKRLHDFAMMVEANDDDCFVIEQNTWEREAGEISQALYFLLVQKWDA